MDIFPPILLGRLLEVDLNMDIIRYSVAMSLGRLLPPV